MKVLLIILSAALFVAVLVYTWMNRDSERVVLTFVTAMLLGLVGFITKESISNTVEKFSKEMSVAAFFGAPEYRELNIRLPYSFELGTYVQQYSFAKKPEDKSDQFDIRVAQKIYFEAIQYAIIRHLTDRFGDGWDVSVKRARTPNGYTTKISRGSFGGVVVKASELAAELGLSRVSDAGATYRLFPGISQTITLPPGTVWSVKRDAGGHANELILKNKYMSMRIRIEEFSASVGIGEYSRIFGGSSVIDSHNLPQVGNAVYRIAVSGEQSWWYNGHPEMPAHRQWADSISEMLESEFSYENIREEHLRRFQAFGTEAIQSIPR